MYWQLLSPEDDHLMSINLEYPLYQHGSPENDYSSTKLDIAKEFLQQQYLVLLGAVMVGDKD